MRTNYRFHFITYFQVLTFFHQKDTNQVNRTKNILSNTKNGKASVGQHK